ncbi:hypothetical protein BN946_scf184674.g9 [Trametes cinnabarina]|uniref:DUF659 domain-containing protein n=1 Tax=Pycnoporus cinnabarinus TaxID=5643 RepID=A0A060SUV8_PYCCI|nr:hypothetical protein BN946_scf184674.g9 [Trametes cinnabarina]
MPPKSDIWTLFEELKDSGGKSVKYLNDKTHSCAWCKGCLNECVRIRHEQELLNVEKGELREARSLEELRRSFKNPGLATSAAAWNKPCNITTDFSGVIPLELFFEKWIPGAKIPDRRQLSGKHLQNAVKMVKLSTHSAVQGKYAIGQSDGWKNIAKTSVITSMMSVNREVHLVQTHDMTGLPKTGQQHVEIIKKDMARMRDVYSVHPIAWVTDDGPNGKGARNLLRVLLPSLITLVCWAHQTGLLAGDYLTFPDNKQIIDASLEIVQWFNNHSSALELFNQEQVVTYQARAQERRLSGGFTSLETRSNERELSERPLALILPAKTQWTSHFQSASRLLAVSHSLKMCVMRHKELLIEIGRKSQTENAQETARRVIKAIEDDIFWTRLERVETHLRPLAVATNILQARHTRMDHVLLMLGNLYRLYDTDNVELDVRERMLARLELRWKKGAGSDQPLFILAVFFNLYIRGYCFDREALPPSDIYNMAIQAFTRFFDVPPGPDFTDTLVDYSQNSAEFTNELMGLAAKEQSARDKGMYIDVVELWSRIDRSNDTLAVCPGRNGIVKLAIRILSVTANSAGVECAFSDFGRTHTKGRSRLSPEVVHNTAMLRMDLRREHAAAGHTPQRLKRKLGTNYEPSPIAQPVTTFTSYAGDDDSDTVDDDLDMITELVQAAIDSSEPSPDSDSEPDDEDTPPAAISSIPLRESLVSSTAIPATSHGSTETPSSRPHPGPLYLTPQNVITHPQTQSLPDGTRRRRAKPKAVHIPLKKLFLYPASFLTASGARPSTPSSPPHEDELRRHFEFIWTGGIRAYQRETIVCEALYPGPRSDIATVSTAP